MRVTALSALDAEQMATAELASELPGARRMVASCAQRAQILSEQLPGLRTRLEMAKGRAGVPDGRPDSNQTYALEEQQREARRELDQMATEHRLWSGRVAVILKELGTLLDYWEQSFGTGNGQESFETSYSVLLDGLLKEAVGANDEAAGDFGKLLPCPERQEGEGLLVFQDRMKAWEHRQTLGTLRRGQAELMSGILVQVQAEHGCRVARELQTRFWSEGLLEQGIGYL